MPSVAVIVPTTGAPLVRQCIESVLAQTHAELKLFVVVDGPEFDAAFRQSTEGLDLCGSHVTVLPVNVGRNGFYGHRIYAAFSHLVDTDYLVFLDQDNWIEPNHIASMLDDIASNGWDWAYALRRVMSEAGHYLIDDESQSVGAWGVAGKLPQLVDTNCYCLRNDVAQQVASRWHGGWGQDRMFYNALATGFPNHGCTGLYTVNYRTRDDNESAVMALLTRENAAMRARHPQGLPWVKAMAPAQAVQA